MRGERISAESPKNQVLVYVCHVRGSEWRPWHWPAPRAAQTGFQRGDSWCMQLTVKIEMLHVTEFLQKTAVFMHFHGFSWFPICKYEGCSAHRIAQCRLRDNQYPPEHQVAQAMGPKICGRWLELSVKNYVQLLKCIVLDLYHTY